MKYILQALLEIFFPSSCLRCQCHLNAEDIHPLCIFCWEEVPKVCGPNPKENDFTYRLWARVPLFASYSLFYLSGNGIAHEIIHYIKYRNGQNCAFEMGKKLGSTLRSFTEFQSVDLILPIPLHWKRKNVRGYNQADLIAKGIGSILGIPCDFTLLRRKRYTSTQTRMDRFSRMNNLKDCYTVRKNIPEGVEHILLVDDVFTTGVTLEEAYLCLMNSSKRALKISMATLAIADFS